MVRRYTNSVIVNIKTEVVYKNNVNDVEKRFNTSNCKSQIARPLLGTYKKSDGINEI